MTALPSSILPGLRRRLGLDPADTSRDDWIQEVGTQMLGVMAAESGLSLEPVEVEEVFRTASAGAGCGCCVACPPVRIVYLPVLLLVSITGPAGEVPVDQCETLGDGSVLFNGEPLPVPASGLLRVVYHSGYTEIPADALLVLGDLIAQAAALEGPAGLIFSGVSKLQIVDVGTVDLSGSDGVTASYTSWLRSVRMRAFAHPCVTITKRPITP